MSNFMNEMRRVADIKTTENGALAYKSSGGGAVLDFFAVVGGMRNRDAADIIAKYRAARAENVELADKIVLYARSIRNTGGLGERRIGKILMRELAKFDRDKVIRNFSTFVENGRFDDLYAFEGTSVENEMWYFMAKTLTNDLAAMNAGKPISLAAKWMKSINTSSEESKRLARKFCQMNGVREKTYRKILSKLRGYSNVVEVKMSAREWDKINFETVPSLAMKRYSTAFGRHCPNGFERYKQELVSGDAKINASTLYPYDITYQFLYGGHADKTILEAQWKALPNFFKEGKNVVAMADVSGSMTGQPMATSIGLAMYCAERNIGAYHGSFLTFTDRPRFYNLDETKSVEARMAEVRKNVGYNTNLDGALMAVYELARKANESPDALLIISDGEIDRFYRPHACDNIVEKYTKLFTSAGVEMPKLIFWNVEARNDTFLGRATNPYVNFVSGSSAGTFANLAELIECTPWEAMVKILTPYKFL